MRLGGLLLSLALVGASALLGQEVPPVLAPEVAFEEGAVAATGLTRGGRVLWFGIGREFDRFALKLVPFFELASADAAKGEARLELERGVPEQSIFFVVDVETGAYAVASPPGYEATEIAFPARGVAPALDRIELQRYTAEIALVRPGVGAWLREVGDGTDADADGLSDGKLQAEISGLEPLG